MGVRRCTRNPTFHKEHPTFRAFAGCVRDDLGMHGASEFNPLRQGRCIEVRDIACKCPFADQPAQVLQPREQALLRQIHRYIRGGQSAKTARAKCENAPGARHLCPDHAGRINKRRRQRSRNQQHTRMARCCDADQPSGVQIEPQGVRNVLSGDNEPAQIPRHGGGNHAANSAQQTLTCARQVHHWRLSAPWLHP